MALPLSLGEGAGGEVGISMKKVSSKSVKKFQDGTKCKQISERP